MFNGIESSALIMAKEKIDFSSLQFPIYRKNEEDKEWYRFDSISRFVSIRTNLVIAIGLLTNASEDTFVVTYSIMSKECSKDEFNRVMKMAIEKIGI